MNHFLLAFALVATNLFTLNALAARQCSDVFKPKNNLFTQANEAKEKLKTFASDVSFVVKDRTPFFERNIRAIYLLSFREALQNWNQILLEVSGEELTPDQIIQARDSFIRVSETEENDLLDRYQKISREKKLTSFDRKVLWGVLSLQRIVVSVSPKMRKDLASDLVQTFWERYKLAKRHMDQLESASQVQPSSYRNSSSKQDVIGLGYNTVDGKRIVLQHEAEYIVEEGLHLFAAMMARDEISKIVSTRMLDAFEPEVVAVASHLRELVNQGWYSNGKVLVDESRLFAYYFLAEQNNKFRGKMITGQDSDFVTIKILQLQGNRTIQ